MDNIDKLIFELTSRSVLYLNDRGPVQIINTAVKTDFCHRFNAYQ